MPSGAVYKVSDHVEFGETLDVRDLVFYRNKEVKPFYNYHFRLSVIKVYLVDYNQP